MAHLQQVHDCHSRVRPSGASVVVGKHQVEGATPGGTKLDLQHSRVKNKHAACARLQAIHADTGRGGQAGYLQAAWRTSRSHGGVTV
eukprot:1161472-Pelagomonas_calceolata.AAC.9